MAGQPLTIDFIPIVASEDDGYWEFGERGNDSTALLFSHTISNLVVGTLQFGGVDEIHSYFLFQDIPVGDPEHVIAARMELVASASQSGSINLTIQCVDEDNASPPGNIDDILDWEYTTESVTWNPGSVSNGGTYQTVDFSSVIAEIVGRPGWSQGNSLIVTIRYLDTLQSDNRRRFRGYNHSTGPAPVLVLEWGEPPAPPENFTLTSIDHKTQEGSWDASDDTDYYELQHADNDEFVDATLISDIETLSQQVESLTPWTAYWARVRACNDIGCSGWSTASTALTMSLYRSRVLQDGPTAYWPMDDPSAPLDDIVDNRNLTVENWGGSSWAFQQPGPFDEALSFRGDGELGIYNSGFPFPASTISISFWYREDNQPFAGFILEWVAINAWRESNSATFGWGVSTGAGSPAIETGISGVRDGEWHHLAFVADSGDAYFYLDGQLASSGSYDPSGGLTTNWAVLPVGWHEAASVWYSEFAVWNGLTLSPTDIGEHYNAAFGIDIPFPDPPANPGGTVVSATQINWFADAVDDADSYILQRRIKVE